MSVVGAVIPKLGDYVVSSFNADRPALVSQLAGDGKRQPFSVLLRQVAGVRSSRRRTCISPANSAELSLNAAKNVETNVRSELIFRAREKLDNKYKLCQTASKATRRLHITAKNTTDTINDALSRIAGGDEFSLPVNPILAS